MIELLRNRRSIRKYTAKAIEADKVDLLKEALLRSPSSKNNKPCKFVFVTDKRLTHSLSESKPHGAAFLKNAPLVVVICADETKSDVWVEDCSIASILLQLTAQSLDLGSCWVQIRKRPHNDDIDAETYIQKLLDLPAKIKVESIIAVGYPDQKREPVSFDELDFEKIQNK